MLYSRFADTANNSFDLCFDFFPSFLTKRFLSKTSVGLGSRYMPETLKLIAKQVSTHGAPSISDGHLWP